MSSPHTSPFEFNYLDASPPPADYRYSIRFQCTVVVLIVAVTVIVQWSRPMVIEAFRTCEKINLESLTKFRELSREDHMALSDRAYAAARRSTLISYMAIGVRLVQFFCYLPFLLSVFLLTSKRHLTGRYLAFLMASYPLAAGVYHSDLEAVSFYAMDVAVFLYQHLIIGFAAFCLAVRQVENWRKPVRVVAYLPPILLLASILQHQCTSTQWMRVLALVAVAASFVCITQYFKLCFRNSSPIADH